MRPIRPAMILQLCAHVLQPMVAAAALIFVANLGASAQQPTQEQAAAQRLELEIKVAELRAALTPAARSQNALAWAMDEIMLGQKLQQLGEFEAGSERLQEAERAYQEAVQAVPCATFESLCVGVQARLADVRGMIKAKGN